MKSVLAADSTRPWLIPPTIRYAVAYANGLYEWTDDSIDRFMGHTKIGVLSGEPSQALYCRELDVERFDATPADAAAFILARQAAGHFDATIYCNRSTMPQVYEACRAEGVTVPRWSIATLDDTRWVDVPCGDLWSVQTRDLQSYDLRIVYGPFDWVTG